MSEEIVVILNNIRSTHNVGSIFRTCEGLGINKIYITGYTPYPITANDSRLPHIAQKLTKDINKTALGAEKLIDWDIKDINILITELKDDGFVIYGLEQTKNSKPVDKVVFNSKSALVLGNEVDGIDFNLLSELDKVIEIPMLGKKESFNVVQAAAMALYYMVHIDKPK